MSDLQVVIAILGMAIVTYFTRVAGFFLIKRIKVTRRVKGFLQALPGTILISIVAPIVFTSGKPELIASAATAVVAWRTGNLAISMVVGVLSVFFLRQIW
jgi:uncharacterized membrane protein